MVSVIGGAQVPLSGTGNVTGVDTFFANNFLIDNRASGGMATAVPVAGVRARFEDDYLTQAVYREILEEGRKYNRVREPYIPSLFIETGFQSAFGAQSFIQTFQSVSATPLGFGSDTVKENFQIPILAGVSWPITNPSSTPVFVDLYGGITLDSWTQTLQGRESGAPGGPGFLNQSNRFTVDPTVGAGVRVAVGDIAGGGIPIIIGANAEVQFRPGSVVAAGSPNFPSETYYGTVGPQANMLFMFRVGIPFGGSR